jgi:hypothetical protein
VLLICNELSVAALKISGQISVDDSMYTYFHKSGIYLEAITMKTHNSFGKIIYWIGFLFFVFGLGTWFGPLDYNSIIPNKSLALIYTCIGIAILLISNFFKKPNNSRIK